MAKDLDKLRGLISEFDMGFADPEPFYNAVYDYLEKNGFRIVSRFEQGKLEFESKVVSFYKVEGRFDTDAGDLKIFLLQEWPSRKVMTEWSVTDIQSQRAFVERLEEILFDSLGDLSDSIGKLRVQNPEFI